MLNRENTKIDRVCPKCGYELNSSRNTRCENCHNELLETKSNIGFTEVHGDCTLSSAKQRETATEAKRDSLFSFVKNKQNLLQIQNLGSFPKLIFNQSRLKITIALILSSIAIPITINAITKSSLEKTETVLNSDLTLSEAQGDRLELKSDSSKAKIAKYSDLQSIENVPNGIFTYGGSNCFAALVREGFHQEIAAAHPNYQLQYLDSEFTGCSANLEPLLDGSWAFAQNARPLTKEDYQLARSRGLKLQSAIVAFDSVVPYIHETNKVKSLTVQQLRDIYLGKITNWKEVGGIDSTITIVALNSERDGDVRLLLKGQKLKSDSVITVRNHTSAISTVSRNRSAIALASAAILKGQESIKPIALATNETNLPIAALLADGSVNLEALDIQAYPLMRSLSVVTRQDNSIGSRAGIAYINFLNSHEGREFILKAGFFPVSSE